MFCKIFIIWKREKNSIFMSWPATFLLFLPNGWCGSDKQQQHGIWKIVWNWCYQSEKQTFFFSFVSAVHHPFTSIFIFPMEITPYYGILSGQCVVKLFKGVSLSPLRRYVIKNGWPNFLLKFRTRQEIKLHSIQTDKIEKIQTIKQTDRRMRLEN